MNKGSLNQNCQYHAQLNWNTRNSINNKKEKSEDQELSMCDITKIIARTL